MEPYAAYVFYTMQQVIDFQVAQLEALGVAEPLSAPQARPCQL